MGILQEKIIYRLVLLYKELKAKSGLPTDDLILLTRSGRNHHSVAFQTPTSGTDIYKGFFPHTIRDWNTLPDFVISSDEIMGDCIAKFTSLVKARD